MGDEEEVQRRRPRQVRAARHRKSRPHAPAGDAGIDLEKETEVAEGREVASSSTDDAQGILREAQQRLLETPDQRSSILNETRKRLAVLLNDQTDTRSGVGGVGL